MQKYRAVAVGTLLVATLFSGCGSDSNSTTSATQEMQINFKAKYGNETLMCSENGAVKSYYNSDQNRTISIKDFRLFVSNVYLIDESGTKNRLELESNDFQYSDENGSVVLLDFEDNSGNCIDRKNTPDTNTVASGEIKSALYSKIEFTLGVPFTANHREYPDVKVLNWPGMAWSWQAGRKFTKLENTNDLNSSYIFNVHLGSTGCQDSNADGETDSCIQPNRVTVTMDFDPTKDEIVIDYAQLLGDANLSSNQGGAPGCMSALNDPECSIIIPNFGLNFDAKDGQCANGNCVDQKLFSVGIKE